MIISGIGEAELIAGGTAVIISGVVYEAGSWVYEKYLNIKFNQKYPKSKKHKEIKESSDFRTEGEANSSADRVDGDGNVITRRWYDEDGGAYKDVDFTNNRNFKKIILKSRTNIRGIGAVEGPQELKKLVVGEKCHEKRY